MEFTPLSEKARKGPPPEILSKIRTHAPDAYIQSHTPGSTLYHLKSKDTIVVEKVLRTLESERTTLGILSYDLHGTSIEDIFLKLMKENGQGLATHSEAKPTDDELLESKENSEVELSSPRILQLTNGRKRSPVSQALTIFHKRCLVARRAWLTPVLSFIIAVAGSCVPLFFLNGRAETCVKAFDPSPLQPLYFPFSLLQISTLSAQPGNAILTSPPNITQLIGPTFASVRMQNVQDNATFVSDVQQNFQNYSLGGISLDLSTGNSLVAWEATPPGLTGPTMLNLASNVLYNNALPASSRGSPNTSLIFGNLQSLPAVDGGTLFALKWTAFFGACMVGSSFHACCSVS